MTGRYTVRLGTQANVIYWDTPWGISLNETFISQNMKDAGYTTALFGKWHLGMYKEEYTPIRKGFDEHMGYLQGCGSRYTHVAACCQAGSPDHDQNFTCATQPGLYGDYLGYDWFKSGPAPNTGKSVPDPSANNTNSAFLIRNAAVEFIRRVSKTAQPFFLYLPFQNVHGPHTCDKKYRDLYATGGFGEDEQTLFGYISEMDDAVGDVIAALKASGRYSNSIIFFSSDNGAPPDGDADHQTGSNPGYIARNHPFRGWKTQIWEGGTRVAGFVHSPLLPAAVRGTQSHKLFHVTDWLPTIVAAAGGSTARNRPLDGFDIWPAVSRDAASPRTEMLYNVNPLCEAGQAVAPKAALRVGDYKVLAWCYSVKGINGSSVTGPVSAPKGTRGADPEFEKGPRVV